MNRTPPRRRGDRRVLDQVGEVQDDEGEVGHGLAVRGVDPRIMALEATEVAGVMRGLRAEVDPPTRDLDDVGLGLLHLPPDLSGGRGDDHLRITRVIRYQVPEPFLEVRRGDDVVVYGGQPSPGQLEVADLGRVEARIANSLTLASYCCGVKGAGF